MGVGRFADAIAIYEELVKALPANQGLRMNLGMAQHLAGRDKDAVQTLGSETDPRAQAMCGVSYMRLGDAAKAADFLERAVRSRARASVHQAPELQGVAQAVRGVKSARARARRATVEVRLTQRAAGQERRQRRRKVGVTDERTTTIVVLADRVHTGANKASDAGVRVGCPETVKADAPPSVGCTVGADVVVPQQRNRRRRQATGRARRKANTHVAERAAVELIVELDLSRQRTAEVDRALTKRSAEVDRCRDRKSVV